MAWIIHFRNSEGRELTSRQISRRDFALEEACSLIRKERCVLERSRMSNLPSAWER